jgi:hypothetical protein
MIDSCHLPLNCCSILFHYSKKHNSMKMNQEEIAEVTSAVHLFIDETRNISRSYLSSITRSELNPLPMLEIKNGFECLLCDDDKVYYCADRKMLHMHYLRKHSGRQQLVRPAFVQCFNKQLKSAYFKVRVNHVDGANHSKSNENFLKKKFIEASKIQTKTQKEIKRKTYIQELQMDGVITGLELFDILNLNYSSIPFKDRLQETFEQYFLIGYSLLDKPDECSFLLKRLIRDPKQDKSSNRRMSKFKNESTLQAYKKQGLQLFLFLFRCMIEKVENGNYPLLLNTLDDFPILLYQNLQNDLLLLQQTIQEPLFTNTFGLQDLLFSRIHNVFKSLFFRKQPLSENRMNDICYIFWCIQAYDENTQCFKEPSNLTQPISKMLFFIRLVVLMECHLEKSHLIDFMNSTM